MNSSIYSLEEIDAQIKNNNNTSSELRRLKNQYFPFLDHFTLHDISIAMLYSPVTY